MQILFDMNNLAMRLLHLPMINAATERPNWDFWKYLMFSNIYDFLLTASEGYEDSPVGVVLACDNKERTWRSEVYAPYKGNRVKKQDIDWDMVFTHLDMFLADIANHMPWKVLKIDRCEADDIIAVICSSLSETGEHCVVHSGDADYLQLVSDTVSVYAPHKDEFISFPCEVKIAGTKVQCGSVEEFLQLSILTGQGCKDNVYNVKTPTDWAPTEEKKRKPPFGVVAAKKVLNGGITESLEKIGCLENYNRNKTLIDFGCIPADVRQLILEAFNSYQIEEPKTRDFLNRYTWPSLQGQANDIHDVITVLAGFEPTADQYFEDMGDEDAPEEIEDDFVI